MASLVNVVGWIVVVAATTLGTIALVCALAVWLGEKIIDKCGHLRLYVVFAVYVVRRNRGWRAQKDGMRLIRRWCDRRDDEKGSK